MRKRHRDRGTETLVLLSRLQPTSLSASACLRSEAALFPGHVWVG